MQKLKSRLRKKQRLRSDSVSAVIVDSRLSSQWEVTRRNWAAAPYPTVFSREV
jgi:hypothetical protein